ncbi:MAG TPA: SusC/RagA family TonB-linked outer membrane protein [Porphyromonadaceae bacterium]|nr:SusC/RagA family TonB-linked outer membrane protein [Porphyromonadaceae bacterium]
MKKVYKMLPLPPLRFLIILACIFGLNSGFQVYGQAGTITGSVVDEIGDPLPGVNISVKGTSQGIMTDLDGKFSLTVPNANAVLSFSYIGYLTQEITVGTQTEINIQLKEDTQKLEEVIVVGYGTQKKVNMTGSVSAVKIDEKITSRSLSNVSSGLQGLVPGLQVTNTTGMAGEDGATLMIRGFGSVNGTTPLVVVDGMPDVDINRINFQDVESISVLKDAASASVYGSRASNGVILITTRSGAGENKTKIDFNASYALERPTRSYDFMADYARALTLHQYAAAASTKRESYNFKDGTIDQWLAMGMIDPYRFPNTEIYDTFMRNGELQNYTVSASGGSDKSNFYISVGMMDKQGVQINNDFERYNTRFNMDYKLLNNLKTGVRFDGNWSEFSYSGLKNGMTDNDTGNSAGGDMQYAISGILPYDPITGRFGGVMAYGEDTQAYNPYVIFNKGHMPKQTRQELNGSMYLEWNIFKGFKAHIDYALRYTDYFQKIAYIPTGFAYNFQTGQDVGREYVGRNSGVSDNQTTLYKTQLNGRLNYNTVIAQHHDISTMFVYSEEYWHSRSNGASRNDRLHPSITEINGSLTNVLSNSGSSYSEGLRSYVGRLNYSGYDKYLLEFSFRVDGSSRFYKGSQYGFFPSVSAGWRFTEESFIKPFTESWLTSGKIRGSWGQVGYNRGVDLTEQQELLSTQNYYSTQVISGFVNKKMINRNLSWETATSVNIGLDLSFLEGRFMSEIEYYDRLTSDMIRPSQLSILLEGAYNAPDINVGSMRNRGIDFNLTWRDKVNDFEYSVNLNGAFNQNRLEKWNELLTRTSKDRGKLVFLNMPYNYLYTYEHGGIAQTWADIYNNTPQGIFPGDVIRKDLNGDGIIDDKDLKAYPNIQRDNPTFTYGITLSANYKGFDIVGLFNGTTGRKDYWYTDFNKTSVPDKRYAFTWDHWNKPWSLENRNADRPRLATSTSTGDNSFWLYDMSYLRLKNVQIGYTLPKHILSKISISNARIFVSGENIFTLTEYPGLDPEKPNSARDLYPINRSYAAGVNVSF